MTKQVWEGLRAFRSQVYARFGCRRDALFELIDALLTSGAIESPAHLSLAPTFQRKWGSVYDALNAGTMDVRALEQLISQYPLDSPTRWYAIDASVWPRCDAETSPARGYYHHATRQSHGQPIVAGWNYSWFVQTPEQCSSWTAPLRVRRIMPGENVNRVAADQVRSWLHSRPPQEAALPVISFDAGYDPIQLGLALATEHDQISLLIRLRTGRCFYGEPPPGPTGGRPRRHGRKFVCEDATSWPIPTQEWHSEDPGYGHVHVQAWSDLHPVPQNHATRGTRQPRPIVHGTLIRLEVSRLPRPTKTPDPLWFWWWAPVPPNLEELWHAYQARFAIEHMFRFFKQVCRWTTPKLRSPAAADRWTWLVLLAYIHLRLARPLVTAVRLPWQPSVSPTKLTPARVRRGFSHLLPTLGTPVKPPKPCGTSPGRPKGRRSRPAKRFPAIKITA